MMGKAERAASIVVFLISATLSSGVVCLIWRIVASGGKMELTGWDATLVLVVFTCGALDWFSTTIRALIATISNEAL